jgi:hypothetical protein
LWRVGRTKAGVKMRGYRGKPALHEASAVDALIVPDDAAARNAAEH